MVAKQSQNTAAEHIENNQIVEDKSADQAAAQLKQISIQKVVTPKQLIKSNIRSNSRSLSTPRNENPHVRVLDINCSPNRLRLSEINVNKNESISNTSRFFNETPHNRSIASSLPSSAPPKVDSSFQSRRISIEKSIESSTADVFVPIDENTRISGDSETPKSLSSSSSSSGSSSDSDSDIDSSSLSGSEVIEALPITRATRSSARNQRTAIAPAKNIITQSAAAPAKQRETDESDNDASNDEEDEEDESYEMVLSIDESDKKRFFCLRENALALSKTAAKPKAEPVMVGKKEWMVLPDNIRVTLEPSDVMELYTQNLNSVVEMKKNIERTRSSKETKSEVNSKAIKTTATDTSLIDETSLLSDDNETFSLVSNEESESAPVLNTFVNKKPAVAAAESSDDSDSKSDDDEPIRSPVRLYVKC